MSLYSELLKFEFVVNWNVLINHDCFCSQFSECANTPGMNKILFP